MNLHLMDTNLIALAALAILIIAALIWMYVRKSKTRNTTADLRRKFGPEYDRAVRVHGAGRKAEIKLEDREKRFLS